MKGRAADLVRAAIEAGHPKEQAQFFENSREAAKFLEKFASSGDLLLVKGSRGVKMEKILEALDARHKRSGSRAPREALEAGGKGRA